MNRIKLMRKAGEVKRDAELRAGGDISFIFGKPGGQRMVARPQDKEDQHPGQPERGEHRNHQGVLFVRADFQGGIIEQVGHRVVGEMNGNRQPYIAGFQDGIPQDKPHNEREGHLPRILPVHEGNSREDTQRAVRSP